MSEWIAVVMVAGTLQGQPYRQEHRFENLTSEESCVHAARTLRNILPAGLRLGRARCERVWKI